MTKGASSSTSPTIPAWILGFGILTSLLLALGAGISLLAPQRLAPPRVEVNAAVHVYAGYTFSRDLSLLIVLIIALLRRSRPAVSIVMGLFSLINLFDAVMDVAEGRYPIVVIALLLSLLGMLAFFSAARVPAESIG